MHQERLGHHVAQEAEAGHDRAERGGLRDDVGELDLEDVAGLRALDEDRAGEWMDRSGVQCCQVGDGGGGRDLAVQRVEGFEGDLFAFADLDGGCDVGVVAVVAAVRLVAQVLGAVDADGLHGSGPAG